MKPLTHRTTLKLDQPMHWTDALDLGPELNAAELWDLQLGGQSAGVRESINPELPREERAILPSLSGWELPESRVPALVYWGLITYGCIAALVVMVVFGVPW